MNDQLTIASSMWLSTAKKSLMAQKSQPFTVYGMPFFLEWQLVEPKSPELNAIVRSSSEILVPLYAAMELHFARQYPESVPNEMFLSSLAPLFEHGVQAVDWGRAHERITATLAHFFTTTDFAHYSGADDLTFFVYAKAQSTGKMMGLIQFLITPEYADGDVRVCFYGAAPGADEERMRMLLMSSLFTLLPQTKRIFLHTRITNESAIAEYRGWGFTEFAGPLPHWIDLEYKAEVCNLLQENAVALIGS